MNEKRKKSLRADRDNRQKQDEEQDDETKILKGLFGKGMHSALKHDMIVEASNPEAMIVFKEAEDVAKKAALALRKSREDRNSSTYHVPTWTGRSGTAGAPNAAPTVQKLFGTRTNVILGQLKANGGDKAQADSSRSPSPPASSFMTSLFPRQDRPPARQSSSPAPTPPVGPPLSSSSLLKAMSTRNSRAESAGHNALVGSSRRTARPAQETGSDDEGAPQPEPDAPEPPETEIEQVEPLQKNTKEWLIVELHDFLSRKGGRVTSEQVLTRFEGSIKGEVTIQLVRAMLKEIADFKTILGVGKWVLKPEYGKSR